MNAQQAAEQQQENPLFVCTECGDPVVVFGGNYFRTCEHTASLVAATHDGLKAASNGVSLTS